MASTEEYAKLLRESPRPHELTEGMVLGAAYAMTDGPAYADEMRKLLAAHDEVVEPEDRYNYPQH